MTLRSNRGRKKKQAEEEIASNIDSTQVQQRGVIYARYSNGGNQTDQSLEGQVRDCRKYVLDHNIKIVGEYLDAHISGKEAENRPEFQRMIADSKKRLFDVVIVWKTDRFARSRYDSALYKELLKHNNVTIHYAAEHIPETPEGIILESMLEGMAEYYSAELKQKIERGIKESAYKCKALTYPPMGLRINKEKHYEIDEETAPLIRQVFEMYIRGDKLIDIANTMNSLGLRTKKGNPLQISSITKIITNEKYIGVYEYRNGGIRKEDAIPAIVDKETFYLAQERYKAQQYGTYSKKNYGGSAKRVYTLGGIVICGECGSTMYGETITKHRGTPQEYCNIYYSCRCHRKGSGKDRCNMRSIPAERLEEAVSDSLKELFMNETLVDSICSAVEEVGQDDQQDIRIKQLRAEKKAKEKAIQNNLRFIDSGMFADSIVVHLKALEAELATIDRKIKFCQTFSPNIKNQLKWLLRNYEPRPEEAAEYWSDLIHCFVNSVICYKNGVVLIRFNVLSPTDPNGPPRRLGTKKNIDEYIRNARMKKKMSKAGAKNTVVHSISATFQLIKRLIGCRFLLFEII